MQQSTSDINYDGYMNSSKLIKLTTDVAYILTDALFSKYGADKVLNIVEIESESETIFGENFILAASVFAVLFDGIEYVSMTDIIEFTKSLVLVRDDLNESEFLESVH